MYTYLPTYLSIYLPTYLAIYLSMQSIHPSIHLSFLIFQWLYVSSLIFLLGQAWETCVANMVVGILHAWRGICADCSGGEVHWC
jgi:hypothetical protein